MAVYKIDSETFKEEYHTVAQIQVNLADTTNVWIEAGRGSGKTTKILAERIDRVMNDLPGAPLVLVAPTYKSIFDNVLPSLIEYFRQNYVEDAYYCIGKKPPTHFKQCDIYIKNWLHTFSLHNGCVLQFASIDRPESMAGKNTPHIFADELLLISEDKFVKGILPALRANRALYGHSHYFGGITGTSSTPNFDTDNDWFLANEKLMDRKLIANIQTIQKQIDTNRYYLERYKSELKQAVTQENIIVLTEKVKKHETFVNKWTERVNLIRKNQHFYMRVSSFSNIKVLGLSYIKTQRDVTKDKSRFHTSILAVRSRKPKELFAGKFGKEHLYLDSYKYDAIDKISAGAYDKMEHNKATNLKYWDSRQPLYCGYDPGPFSSAVFAQRMQARGKRTKQFRTHKDFFVIHPMQQEELAQDINAYFEGQQNKTIFLHYDRAANQREPHYRKYYPNRLATDLNDTDAQLLKRELEKLGWKVKLMSVGMPKIEYWQHYMLLNIMLGKNDGRRDELMVDENEAPYLTSSIQCSPLKKSEGRIMLDKSSEKELDYEEQALWSTQIFTAWLYLIYGEYKNELPKHGYNTLPQNNGTWTT